MLMGDDATVYNIYDECGRDDRRRMEESSPAGRPGRLSNEQLRQALSAPVVDVSTADSFKVTE